MSIPDKKGKEDIRKGIITAMSKEGATFLYTEMWILEKKRTDEDMATFPQIDRLADSALEIKAKKEKLAWHAAVGPESVNAVKSQGCSTRYFEGPQYLVSDHTCIAPKTNGNDNVWFMKE